MQRNLALRVNPGETADAFIVSGRGALHLGILIENMRREGYEFEIGPPKVITKEIEGKTCEPFEEAIVEVPDANIGAVVECFAQRKGEMIDLAPFIEGTSRAKFRIGEWISFKSAVSSSISFLTQPLAASLVFVTLSSLLPAEWL